MSSLGVDFGGGPYDAPEPQDWEPDRDGCPECGGVIWESGNTWECLKCDMVFDIDGVPVEANDLEPVDELE